MAPNNPFEPHRIGSGRTGVNRAIKPCPSHFYMIRFPLSPTDHREKRGCPALAEQPLWLRYVRYSSLETLAVALTLALLAKQLLQILAQLLVGNTAVAGIGRAIVLLLVL